MLCLWVLQEDKEIEAVPFGPGVTHAAGEVKVRLVPTFSASARLSNTAERCWAGTALVPHPPAAAAMLCP